MIQEKWKQKAKPVLICFIAGANRLDESPAIFYRSYTSWSPLWWRVPICLWAVVITILSITQFWGPREMFFLYMTHWGLLMIIAETIFGITVCVKKPKKDLNQDAVSSLPWYVKTYWVLYNITIPVAFLVTVFYWGILTQGNDARAEVKVTKVKYSPDPVLDVMLHGVNSLIMLVELVCSSHPSRLIHVMQPLYFAGVYMLFTVIYYFAGGVDPWGNPFVYPVINWSKPKQTLVVLTLTALFLGLMHLLVVSIAASRDFFIRKCLKSEPCENEFRCKV